MTQLCTCSSHTSSFKTTYEEDDDGVTTLSYKKIFKLIVKIKNKNEKLERNIVDFNDHIEFLESSNKFKNHIEFFESRNKRLHIELDEFRRQSLKSNICEICDSLKYEIKSLHETLGKSTKDKESLDLTLLNQRVSYSKIELGYQPNQSLISICQAKKKTNWSLFKCNCISMVI